MRPSSQPTCSSDVIFSFSEWTRAFCGSIPKTISMLAGPEAFCNLTVNVYYATLRVNSRYEKKKRVLYLGNILFSAIDCLYLIKSISLNRIKKMETYIARLDYTISITLSK